MVIGQVYYNLFELFFQELEEALVTFKSKSSRDQPFSETDYLLIRVMCILLQGYFTSYTIKYVLSLLFISKVTFFLTMLLISLNFLQ